MASLVVHRRMIPNALHVGFNSNAMKIASSAAHLNWHPFVAPRSSLHVSVVELLALSCQSFALIVVLQRAYIHNLKYKISAQTMGGLERYKFGHTKDRLLE